MALRHDLLELALADVKSRMRRFQTLHGTSHDLGAGRMGEERQLVERRLGVKAALLAAALHGDEICAFLNRSCGVQAMMITAVGVSL